METIRHLIPFHQLPPGFTETLKNPPDPPALPRKAATLALLREGTEGLEVLLLKRSSRTGFIPGAYVFPGGRVDGSDADPALLELLAGLDPREAEARLNPGEDDPPAWAFYAAALRETFEETGVFLAGGDGECRAHALGSETPGSRAREQLLNDRITFLEAANALGLRPDAGKLRYLGHWVTPVQEPRRFDTRFFGAQVPPGCEAFLDGGEMVEALWITPGEALARNREGTLPLVLPTVATLRQIQTFQNPTLALDALGRREVRRIMPQASLRPEGVEFVVEG